MPAWKFNDTVLVAQIVRDEIVLDQARAVMLANSKDGIKDSDRRLKKLRRRYLKSFEPTEEETSSVWDRFRNKNIGLSAKKEKARR